MSSRAQTTSSAAPMASPVTFCAVHKPLIRLTFASGVCVCSIVYCSNELTALASRTAPDKPRLKSTSASGQTDQWRGTIPAWRAASDHPGSALCASFPLVNAPIAAPSGIAASRKPICAADICQLSASAGYSTRTALAIVNKPPSSEPAHQPAGKQKTKSCQ